jgi:glycosyltransferase involved in cell wall biosynthesis
MGTPRTSFVIPARDAQATLERTLDSVLAQTDADWEALLVDDGSRDETPQLIETWCARDGRFVALSSGGRGVSAARNAGIARARGARLVFLDSDDWLDASFLQVMHAALDTAPDAAAAYCDYQRVWPDAQTATVPSDDGLVTSPFDTFARTCAVAIHAVLVPRDAVMRAGLFDTALRTCEDWDLWQRIARLGGRWVHVAQPLACYRLHAGSLSQDMGQAQADGAVVIRRGYGDEAGVDVALAYHALWCHAFALVRGVAPSAPAALQALPADDEHALYIAQTLADAAVLALLVAPQDLARHEAQHGPPIAALTAVLGSLWGDDAAARRVQHTYARIVASLDAPRGSTTVGCVVPAYNAEATLDETLRSVRAQTHRALEIIVVDDGSTDITCALALRHAAEDARVRLLRQANAGVAAARNAGWRASRADFIAFIDADDLWAPTKIERQLAVLQAAGPRAGLAYCWVSEIDSAGRVLQKHGQHRHEGAVLDAIVRSNFLGCGSTPLLRRQALADAGGFDPRLRAAGAQGCEDWLLYARVAAVYDYARVPDHLVGYRLRADSMSSDRSAMLRSHVLMCEQMAALSPPHRRALLGGLRDYCATLLSQTPHAHILARAALLWAVRNHPSVWLRSVGIDLPRLAWRRLRARLARGRGLRPAAAAAGPLFLPPSS